MSSEYSATNAVVLVVLSLSMVRDKESFFRIHTRRGQCST